MTPEQALIHFGITDIKKIKPISVGLTHATYKVDAKSGAFVLQNTHPILSSDGLMHDYESVSAHLTSKGFEAQTLVRTTDNKLSLPDDVDGSVRQWRLLTFVPGNVVATLGTAAEARAVGRVVAEFHSALADYKKPFKSKLPLHPYDVAKFYKDFARVAKKFARDPLMAPVADEVEFLLREIPKLLLPDSLPARAVHGDLKITNFVFDASSESRPKVRAIIDLDTCARFPVLYELGDALRSWCGGAEDDPKNSFNAARYRAAVAGYLSGAPRALSSREQKLLPRAVKLIILNLASRFLKDYFEDFYFGWDTKRYGTRRDANLARARGQIALYRSACKKL